MEPPDPNRALAPIKRVALFAESFLPKVDGVSKTAFLTMRYLQNTGREVLVFAPDTAPRAIGNVRVIPLPSVGWAVAPETRMALPHPSITQHLDEFRPDMVHLFSPALLSLGGMSYARQHRIPVIANYQTDLPAYANHYNLHLFSHAVRDSLRFLHNQCHLTLVPSGYTGRQLRDVGFHRLRKWSRGVNTHHYTPARRSDEWRARLLNGRDPDSFLIIFVGRLANEKKVDLLLEAARQPGVSVTIIGDGALRPELEAQFAGTNTHFMGYLYGEDLANAYASADAFFFTGVSETFGQVVHEAMASGLPCVVPALGGVTDLVRDGVNGYTVQPERESFARAAVILRDDLDLRRRMGEASRRAAENAPWHVIMAQLEGHYMQALRMSERFNRLTPPPANVFEQIIQLSSVTLFRKPSRRVS
jgi:phosphatidylinositol alpha 1,6-mannosyltransferase